MQPSGINKTNKENLNPVSKETAENTKKIQPIIPFPVSVHLEKPVSDKILSHIQADFYI